MEQVLIILTVPAEFSETAKAVMRDCVFQANLIATKNSEKLQFSTERKFYLPLTSFVVHFFFIFLILFFLFNSRSRR